MIQKQHNHHKEGEKWSESNSIVKLELPLFCHPRSMTTFCLAGDNKVLFTISLSQTQATYSQPHNNPQQVGVDRFQELSSSLPYSCLLGL